MTDIKLQLTIPNDRGKLPPSDHPILTLYAKDSQGDDTKIYKKHLRFSVNGSEYIHVYAPTGDVLLTHKFFQANVKGK
ncbi:hypothetical protein NQ314_012504 [Rhamnusium bicolor]|uniref:Uncharacterized protein n=1 Tax=Rhamnusium bicolor TaxID=1586634 RepID=A0AAV8XBU8_9CUCU|nr:hypothetical protein NQ314_012504 [Rhamnusium bicolor]